MLYADDLNYQKNQTKVAQTKKVAAQKNYSSRRLLFIVFCSTWPLLQ